MKLQQLTTLQKHRAILTREVARLERLQTIILQELPTELGFASAQELADALLKLDTKAPVRKARPAVRVTFTKPQPEKRRKRRSPMSKARRAKIISLLGQKLPGAKVAAKCGVSVATVYNVKRAAKAA